MTKSKISHEGLFYKLTSVGKQIFLYIYIDEAENYEILNKYLSENSEIFNDKNLINADKEYFKIHGWKKIEGGDGKKGAVIVMDDFKQQDWSEISFKLGRYSYSKTADEEKKKRKIMIDDNTTSKDYYFRRSLHKIIK